MPESNVNLVIDLAIALALGLVIGIERDWRERNFKGGRRPAGLRTFGLIGLGGGVAGAIGARFSAFPAIGLALTIIVLTAAYWRRSQDGEFMGLTTIFAALVAYSCGVLAVTGMQVPATAAAVIAAMILGAKDRLHRFVRRLERSEIFAALQFVLLAGVILPLIPNQSLGPYQAINPFELWLMVVLITGLSFAGYIAFQSTSAKRVIGAAVLGGLVSSTATTLSFARLARKQPELSAVLSVGIIAASTIMFVRVCIIASVISPPLGLRLLLPVGLVTLASAAGAAYLARGLASVELEKPTISHPLDIGAAVTFAGLLGVIMIGSRALEATFGAEGVYAISVVSGLADVDAITLSLSRFATDDLAIGVAAAGIMLAAITNTLVKIALAAFAGGGVLRPAYAVLGAAALIGVAAAAFTVGVD